MLFLGDLNSFKRNSQVHVYPFDPRSSDHDFGKRNAKFQVDRNAQNRMRAARTVALQVACEPTGATRTHTPRVHPTRRQRELCRGTVRSKEVRATF